MHVVIFGLTVSSSWGNGHATLWRSLIRAMTRRGHTVVFYERDVPYYASTRDLWSLGDGARLVLYSNFEEIRRSAKREVDAADLALCTSYCPDGRIAGDLIADSKAGVRGFYDMDTPVTLQAMESGRIPEYLPSGSLADFDLVLSFTGGAALTALQERMFARQVAPLYGSVDPDRYRPMAVPGAVRSALSYLGTYAEDRQEKLETLLLEPAKVLAASRFVIAGAQYPARAMELANVRFLEHLGPADHAAFFSSSRATLNITRAAMVAYGFCPSGRLFEAAACGATLLSDTWVGLDSFFLPGAEIVLVESTQDVVDALGRSDEELGKIGAAARERVLSEHTGEARVAELEVICGQVHSRQPLSGYVGQEV